MTVPVRTTLLEEALEAWEYTRQGVLLEAVEVPDGEWGFRPVPGARSVHELVRHILESGLMMVGELTREDSDFQRQGYQEHVAEHAARLPTDPSPSDLRVLLTSSLAEGLDAFRGVGELHMLQLVRRFDGSYGTRLAWLQHGVEHESYHRGQLAAWVRLSGRVPALTQRIEAS